MKVQTVTEPYQPLDLIVAGDGNQITVEFDVSHNHQVKLGDRYVAQFADGSLAVLRVVNHAFDEGDTPLIRRYNRAQREGTVGPPRSRQSREALQRMLVTMQIEGELHPDGRRTFGARRLPERATPVWPITEEQLERFSSTPDGNLILGVLMATDHHPIAKIAKIKHNFAGERLVLLGMPGSGKSQLVRAILSQHMAQSTAPNMRLPGMLILDRAGEYIEDSYSEAGYRIYGLPHHPNAPERLVIVSHQEKFRQMAAAGRILAHLRPVFNLQDIDPIDLCDFYPSLTPVQRGLLRDYAHDPHLYAKLLRETKLGLVDKSHWFRDFPGLFELTKNGKALMKQFEDEADTEDVLSDEQIDELLPHLGGSKHKVMERLILGIKRFAGNPFLGGQKRGRDILRVPSCVGHILKHLQAGRTVIIDLRGVDKENYTLVAALFARKLLTENKQRSDGQQIHTCLVVEEAQNLLSESELRKGLGRGSVFFELAREGRKLKLGFVLVTQQPDPRSIATEIAATLDTVVAFNMPPDNALYLNRIKGVFDRWQNTITEAHTFEAHVKNKCE